MAGLVPAIHVFLAGRIRKNVDARDKPGHDAVIHIKLIMFQRSGATPHAFFFTSLTLVKAMPSARSRV